MKGARKIMRMLIVLCEWRNINIKEKCKTFIYFNFCFDFFNIYYMMEEDVIGRESI